MRAMFRVSAGASTTTSGVWRSGRVATGHRLHTFSLGGRATGARPGVGAEGRVSVLGCARSPSRAPRGTRFYETFSIDVSASPHDRRPAVRAGLGASGHRGAGAGAHTGTGRRSGAAPEPRGAHLARRSGPFTGRHLAHRCVRPGGLRRGRGGECQSGVHRPGPPVAGPDVGGAGADRHGVLPRGPLHRAASRHVVRLPRRRRFDLERMVPLPHGVD